MGPIGGVGAAVDRAPFATCGFGGGVPLEYDSRYGGVLHAFKVLS